MKKKFLYLVLAIAVLAILVGLGALWFSGVQVQMERYYVEHLGERDATIAGLQSEIVNLQSEKSALWGRLNEETLTKEAVRVDLATLQTEFKWATKESMRIEGKLTESLNKVAADADALQKKLNSELASKKVLVDDLLVTETLRSSILRRYWYGLAEIQYQAEEINGLKLEKSVLEGQMDVAKKLVKAALLHASGQLINAGNKTVRPVIVVPADLKLSIDGLDKMKTAIGKTMAINQLWFFSQTGMTFSRGELIVIRGEKSAIEYDRLSPGERMIEIRKEINIPWYSPEIIFSFLYGSNDESNRGGPLNVIINGSAINLIINDDARGWAIGAHELGHALGLPHLATENKLAIMRVNAEGWAEAANFFPFAIFTDAEKIVVRKNLGE